MSVHQVTDCKIRNITFYRHVTLPMCSDESFNYGTAHPKLFDRDQTFRDLPQTYFNTTLPASLRFPRVPCFREPWN